MANQFTVAAAEGREIPPGANQFTTGSVEKHEGITKDRMRAEKAAHKLERHIDGELVLTSEQIAACKALIPYGKPMLSSVESHEGDPLQDLTVEEMKDMVSALILAHPEIIQALNLVPAPELVPTITDKHVQPEGQQGIQGRDALSGDR